MDAHAPDNSSVAMKTIQTHVKDIWELCLDQSWDLPTLKNSRLTQGFQTPPTLMYCPVSNVLLRNILSEMHYYNFFGFRYWLYKIRHIRVDHIYYVYDILNKPTNLNYIYTPYNNYKIKTTFSSFTQIQTFTHTTQFVGVETASASLCD